MYNGPQENQNFDLKSAGVLETVGREIVRDQLWYELCSNYKWEHVSAVAMYS